MPSGQKPPKRMRAALTIFAAVLLMMSLVIGAFSVRSYWITTAVGTRAWDQSRLAYLWGTSIFAGEYEFYWGTYTPSTSAAAALPPVATRIKWTNSPTPRGDYNYNGIPIKDFRHGIPRYVHRIDVIPDKVTWDNHYIYFGLWLPMLILFTPSALWFFRLYRTRRLAPGLCRKCGYDLRASSGRCPECGVEFHD